MKYCIGCPYNNYDDQDDGERVYVPVCTKPKGEDCPEGREE